MSISEKDRVAPIAYGCDELGRLKSALVHTPGEELELIDEANHRSWLFEEVPDVDRFAGEHRQLVETLEDNGVKVFQLIDFLEQTAPSVRRLPNMTYLQDVATVAGRGAILSRMASAGRRGEEAVVKEALANLGVPVWHEFTGDEDAFEGCLVLSPSTLLVANTQQHRESSIRTLLRTALDDFEEVVYADVPQKRRFAHPATVFNMITPRLAMAYLPAFEQTRLLTRESEDQIDFERYLRQRGIDLIAVSDSEQRRKACSFVTLESGLLFQFDTAWDRPTLKELCRLGVDVVFYHPQALLAGGRGLSCMTLQLCRRPPCPVAPTTGGEWED